jgi:hypothetical protein
VERKLLSWENAPHIPTMVEIVGLLRGRYAVVKFRGLTLRNMAIVKSVIFIRK